MGTITSAICSSYEAELMQAIHDHTPVTGDVFAIALIKPSPAGTYGAANTNYSDLGADEVTGTGYAAGGFAWTAAQNVLPAVQSGVATTSWSANPTWTGATISAAGAMIYNKSEGNRAVAVFSLGGTQSVVGGGFILQLPTDDSADAIVRLA